MKRNKYQKEIVKINKNRLIFIDESGCHLGMNRLYGRAKKSDRIKSFTPFDKGKRVTLIGAIGLKEIKAGLFGEWTVNGELFLSFIEKCLVPVLKKDDVVIMDNLNVHKVAGVREAIEKAGAHLKYLPPYSPDLSPIEPMWSKIKSYLRKKRARTTQALGKAICEAFKTVSERDIQGWFSHCVM